MSGKTLNQQKFERAYVAIEGGLLTIDEKPLFDEQLKFIVTCREDFKITLDKRRGIYGIESLSMLVSHI